MIRSVLAGLAPYVAMIAGIPFFDSGRQVGQFPMLGLWILIWVVLTPPFLLLAFRLLPARERGDGRP